MRKLLRANFARLWKDKTFWLGVSLMAAVAVLVCINFYIEQVKYGAEVCLDGMLSAYVVLIGGFVAAFCSLFLGVEYSDGTIRNKLMVGHRRGAIYLANLVTCLAAGLLMCGAYLVTLIAIGVPLFGGLVSPLMELLPYHLEAILVTTVFTALFTFVAMLNQNKAAVAILCLVTFFALFIASVSINSSLEQPEYWDAYAYFDDTGALIKGEPELNTGYLRGFKREVYEFLDEFLPTSQAIHLSSMEMAHPLRQAGYSLLIILVSTAGGMVVFRRKDLK